MSTTEEDLREQFGLTDFEQDVINMRAKERLNVGNQNLPDPDRSARMLSVAGRTGLPFEVISAGETLEGLESAIEQEDFDAQKWLDDSPAFAEFAAKNPYALSVLKHDAENLSWFEREISRPLSLSTQSTMAQVELNEIGDRRAQGRERWLDTDEERMELLEGRIQEHNFGASGSFRPLIWTVKNLGPMVNIAWQAKEEAMLGAMGGAGIGAYYAGGVGTMLGPVGTAVGTAGGVIGGATVGTGIGFMVGGAEASFRMMRGEQYNRYIQAGFSHEHAAKVAGITGALSALPELSGVGRFIKHIPGVGRVVNWGSERIANKLAGDILANVTVAQASRRLVGRYGANMGWEVFTEVVQDSIATVGQNYLADVEGKPDAHIDYDQWKDDMGHTIVETAKAVILLSGTGPGMSYTQDLRRAARSKEMEQTFQAIAAAAEGSKTRTEAPETYRAFVESVEKKGSTIYVEADKWDELWQSNNEDPNKMAERFGMDLEKLQAAREDGHPIKIPLVAFAEQLAPSKLFDQILPDLKFHEDDMTARERAVFDKNKPQIILDIEASLEALQEAESEIDAESIMQDVGNQLIAAQFDPTSAGHLANLYRGFGVISDRLGIEPQELFEKFFGGVRRMTPEALQRTEVLDPSIDPLLNRLRRDDFPTTRQKQGASLMDFIDEAGGIDPSDPELSAMDFELGALDLGISKAKMGRWKEGGALLSDVAERAAESGFIPEGEEKTLLAAISRELAGEPVYGTTDTGDPLMRDIDVSMRTLDRMMAEAGIVLEDLSNEEVRTLLKAIDTFDQDLTGDQLRQTLQAMINAEDRHSAEADQIDALLARSTELLPLIYQEQNFGDIELTDTVTREGTGEVLQITELAQVKYDRAVKRKNTMKRLLDCVSG
jgi:hypothetical protein